MVNAKKPLFYRMGQVCEMVELESHVVRFWEGEFPQLKPRKNSAGHRVFTAEDVELIQTIKRLLHDEGFTIAGAKRRLQEGIEASGFEDQKPSTAVRDELRAVRSELENLVKRLDAGGAFQ